MGGLFRSVGNLVTSLFGGDEAPAPAPVTPAAAPAVAAPAVMPVPDDKAVKLALQKKQAASSAGRTSRQSTILSQNDGDVLGA